MYSHLCVKVQLTEDEKVRLKQCVEFISELKDSIAKTGKAEAYVEWLEVCVSALGEIRDGVIE